MPIWTKADLASYEARRLSSRAKLEQIVCDDTLGSPPGEIENSGRIIVRVTSFTRRSKDPDNACPKYFIDGLRYAGLLRDDREADIILQVSQVKVKTNERTEIEVLDELQH